MVKKMKMYLLSHNKDTLIGMRFAGVDGVVLHTREETIRKINTVAEDKECGILLITSTLKRLCDDHISSFMERNPMPLILEIPDRYGAGRAGGSILEFIEHSIGIKLDNNNSKKQ